MSSETDSSEYSDAREKIDESVDKILMKIEANKCSEEENKSSEASHEFMSLLNGYDEELPVSVFEWTRTISDDTFTAILVEKLKYQIEKMLNNNPWDVIKVIPHLKTEIDQEYVVQILVQAVDSLSDRLLKKLLLDFVIPALYYPDHQDTVHNVIIDFAFELIKKFPITKFSSQEVKLLISKVLEQHIKVLEKWREQNFKRWHDLWIFLVKFFATYIHGSMDLANKLLRIVEFAFRNSSSEQRIKGYECWKAMIDNASLNMKHMTSPKQIKLLVTPLRAKFSKLEVVVSKRFEVFVYLLEKLQGSSILCLNEFFEFCFGVSNTNYSPKNGQIKFVPSLGPECIQVILAILGDFTNIPNELNRKVFEKAVIDKNNIDRFIPAIVYAIVGSSNLLRLIQKDAFQKSNLLQVLWQALFKILVKASTEVQEKIFGVISNSLDSLLKENKEDFFYLSLLNVFSNLLVYNIDHKIYDKSFKSLLEHFIEFLNEEMVMEELFDHFEEIFKRICRDKNMHEYLTEQLKRLDPSKNEVLVYRLWNTLRIYSSDEGSKSITSILLWTVLHLHKCVNISQNLSKKWSESFSKTSDSNKKIIISEIEKAFKSNPLLTTNISTILASLSDSNISLVNHLDASLLKLMANIVSLPLLSEETAGKLFQIFLKCMKAVETNKDADLDSIENICQCIQKLPNHLKNSTLLELMEKLVQKLASHPDSDTMKKLTNLMSTFPINKYQRRASKMSPEGGELKRSIRMAQMVFSKDGATPNKEKVEALQLFGKEVETRTPLKVKGSILKSTVTSSRSKKIVNSVKKLQSSVPAIYDEPTCEFAVIDTEVKLRKDLLTDHQKEKLKQRREDIPALYQDLSQSQTQSSLSTDTQSNQAAIVVNNNDDLVSMKLPEEESMECQQLQLTMEENAPNSTIENLKKQDAYDSSADSNDEEGNKKSKMIARKDRELMRIQMDIVGGNSFIKNLPSKRPRKIVEKVSSQTPKKLKKSESETTTNSDNQNSVETVQPVTSKDKEPKIIMEPKCKENLPVPPVSSENTVNSAVSDHTTLLTPNRRKNKLMKPIKNFDSPSSEKKKAKLDKAAKVKDPKKRKSHLTDSSASESTESETMLESIINQNIEQNSQTQEKQVKSPVKKTTKIKSKAEDLKLDNTIEEVTQEIMSEVNKKKKSSKEVMKKNKEKVKTIQSQLKLANLSNLEGTSEKSKPKSAKLIFIRELTSAKNPQDTKVSPAGLKRNRDKKSKNIAYTIETPSNISSLVSINDIQPSCSKAINLSNTEVEIEEPRKKRRKIDNDVSLSPDFERQEKLSQKEEKDENEDVETQDEDKNASIEKHELEIPKIKSPIQKNKQNDSSESSLFSPDSPARITRSRTNSPKNVNNSPKKQLSPKAVRSLFKDSEDIIESSQESRLENSIISIGNLSRSKIKQSPKGNNGIDRSEEDDEMGTLSKSSPKNAEIEESQDLKPVSQATTLTCESNYEAQPVVIQVEGAEMHELSDSEKLVSIADTVSIESGVTEENCASKTFENKNVEMSDTEIMVKCEEIEVDAAGSPVTKEIEIETLGTPQKSRENLPGSPVHHDTPTYSKELLDNTIDISPICSQVPDLDDKETKSILVALDAAIGQNASNQTDSKSSDESNASCIIMSSNERSNKLLNMVNVESPVTSQKKVRRKLTGSVHKKTRHEKLFSFYRPNEENEANKPEEEETVETRENPGDMLTFSREVPSPLAVPSSGILKRKLADTDDTYSPVVKRKRVNFSYPCTTSTKLFIRHKDELNTHYRAAFSANLLRDDEDDIEDPFADADVIERGGSEEGMNITNSLSLCSNKPIEERLINCEGSLDPLWKRLSHTAYCDRLKNLLKDKNVETVGDLASLKEVEINRLPFKEPKVKTVRKALYHYYKHIFKKIKESEEPVSEASSTSSEERNEECIILRNGLHEQISLEINKEESIGDVDHEPVNLKQEFRKILIKVKEKESSLEEFGEVFIELVDESDIIRLLENVYNTNFRKFFGKPHWRYLVENIVKLGGTEELFDIISDLAENNKAFAEQLEHIVQVRIDQESLKNILKKKTLVQVSNALQECIEEKEFPRENILQMCLMPLIRSPSDIKNYFNSLTIVQIHDLFIERVQPSDLTCFLDQMREHYGNYTMAECVNKKDVLKICSKEELASTLIEKENEVGAVKHLLSHINNQDKLLELYNYIGSLLPVRNRLESHIEMLRSIPFDNNPNE